MRESGSLQILCVIRPLQSSPDIESYHDNYALNFYYITLEVAGQEV